MPTVDRRYPILSTKAFPPGQGYRPLGLLEKNLVPRPDFQALPKTYKVAALNGFEQMGKAKTGGGTANAEGFADLPCRRPQPAGGSFQYPHK